MARKLVPWLLLLMSASTLPLSASGGRLGREYAIALAPLWWYAACCAVLSDLLLAPESTIRSQQLPALICLTVVMVVVGE